MARNLTRTSGTNTRLMIHCVTVMALLDELKKLCDLQGTVRFNEDYPLVIDKPAQKICLGPFNVSGDWFQTIIARRKAEIMQELLDMGYDLTGFEEPEDGDDE